MSYFPKEFVAYICRNTHLRLSGHTQCSAPIVTDRVFSHVVRVSRTLVKNSTSLLPNEQINVHLNTASTETEPSRQSLSRALVVVVVVSVSFLELVHLS
jgi:hypothetical protein